MLIKKTSISVLNLLNPSTTANLTNFLNFLFCINAVDFEHLGNMLMLLLVGDFSGCFIRVLALPTTISTGTIMNSPSRFAGSKIQPKKRNSHFFACNIPELFTYNMIGSQFGVYKR